MITIQFLLIGLGMGAVYAALATGVVLTYQATGVLNVALGAIATYGAFTYAGLVSENRLILPVGSIGFGHVSEAVALVLAVAVTALLGAIAHLLVFRWLGSASGLSRLAAAVGLLLTVQQLCSVRFASINVAPSILPAHPLKIGSITVTSDRLVLAGVVLVVAGVVASGMRATSVGVATRAMAEDETSAALLGWNPLRLGLVAWTVSCGLAGLLGVLSISFTSVNAGTGSFLVVPALAAALLARLRSFFVAAVGALVLGAVNSEIGNLQATHTWLPQSGLQDAVPFVVIIVAVAGLGGRVPTRGTIEDPRLPPVPRGRPRLRGLLAAAAVSIFLAVVANNQYRLAITVSAISAIVVLSIVLLTGMVGQVSLAQMTFAGASGFSLSLLADRAGVPPVLAALLSVLIAIVVGIVVGLPSLRVRGVSLGVITLGLGVVIANLVFTEPDWTGGLAGSRVPELEIGGWDLGSGPDLRFSITCIVVATLIFAAVGALRGTSLGAQMLLVRSNERAAAATGISTSAVKIIAFATSAGIAGVAGVLFGFGDRGVSYQGYGVAVSLVFVAIAYMGGITSLLGAAVGGALAPGGVVAVFLSNVLHVGEYMNLISAIGLLVALVTAPAGVVGTTAQRLAPFRDRMQQIERPKGGRAHGVPRSS